MCVCMYVYVYVCMCVRVTLCVCCGFRHAKIMSSIMCNLKKSSKSGLAETRRLKEVKLPQQRVVGLTVHQFPVQVRDLVGVPGVCVCVSVCAVLFVCLPLTLKL